MRNSYMDSFNDIVKVRIVGININNYLKRIMKKKINIIRLIPISYREVHVILKYSEYLKLVNIKSIYRIDIIDYRGKLRIKKSINNNIFMIIFIILGIVLIVFLSNFIFSIDVIHADNDIRKLVMDELEKYGIEKYSFKKSYKRIEEIEDKILDNNKDKLEWIEIVSYGTKYTVRVEERKLNKKNSDNSYQNIVSRKDCVIRKIEAVKGEKVRDINTYVKKGDVVIAGYITLPDNSRVMESARGSVLGEVWYTVNIEYPYVYQESILTGKFSRFITLKFLNHRYSFSFFDKYRSFESKEKVLFSGIGYSFVLEEQYEAIVKDEVYTEDMVRVKAVDYVKDKLMSDNSDIKEIKDVKILNSSSNEKSVNFKLFVSAIEEIGKVEVIDG